TRTFPLVTVSLIAANVVIWLWEYSAGVDKEVGHYGYYPCTIDHECVSSLVPHLPWYEGVFSSMFLHGGWLHIAGNMLFLWIFGNNIEDRLRPFWYLLFYLAGGVAATALEVALAPNSTLPGLGASGAIAAVLGAYVVLFPH